MSEPGTLSIEQAWEELAECIAGFVSAGIRAQKAGDFGELERYSDDHSADAAARDLALAVLRAALPVTLAISLGDDKPVVFEFGREDLDSLRARIEGLGRAG